jgi:hypothetical protein
MKGLSFFEKVTIWLISLKVGIQANASLVEWHAPCAKQFSASVSPEKEIPTMRHIGIAALLAIFLASLGGCTARSDRIIYQRYAGYNYCHTKVETAGDPLRPTEREIVDYYGPCDAFD